jgi:hypothetical protein
MQVISITTSANLLVLFVGTIILWLESFKVRNEPDRHQVPNLLYILESNPHPFYSFRGLKKSGADYNACGLDSRSKAVF